MFCKVAKSVYICINKQGKGNFSTYRLRLDMSRME